VAWFIHAGGQNIKGCWTVKGHVEGVYMSLGCPVRNGTAATFGSVHIGGRRLSTLLIAMSPYLLARLA
jgi:hypothetical protein